jgi:hypothetical protein
MSTRARATAPMVWTGAAALALGGAVGAALHLQARSVDLVVVAPLAGGLLIGAALARVVRRVELARPAAAAAAAAAAVAVALAVSLAADWARDRARIGAEIDARVDAERWIGTPETELAALRAAARDEARLGRYLERRYGLDGEPHPSSGLPLAIGPAGAIAVAVGEGVLALAAATLLAHRGATDRDKGEE